MSLAELTLWEGVDWAEGVQTQLFGWGRPGMTSQAAEREVSTAGSLHQALCLQEPLTSAPGGRTWAHPSCLGIPTGDHS